MKNILIMGIGRAGKTTLSNMIKKKHNHYNLIHSDCIKWSMIKAEDIKDYYEQNIEEQNKFEHSDFFQKTLLECFNLSISNDRDNYGYILEAGQLDPIHVKENINFENTLVICLGHGQLSKQDIFDMCRKYDTEEDWSYIVSDENLKKHVDTWYKMNKIFKMECHKFNIKYIDTSLHRQEILAQTLSEISNEIE